MATWKIENVEVEVDSEQIKVVHWRYGPTIYNATPIDGLIASSSEEQIVAALKAALGEDKVAEIEGKEIDIEISQQYPDRITAPPGASIEQHLADVKADRQEVTNLKLANVQEKLAFLEARKEFLSAREAELKVRAERQAAREALDSAIAARDKARDDLATATSNRDTVVASTATKVEKDAARDQVEAARLERDTTAASFAEAKAAFDAAVAKHQPLQDAIQTALSAKNALRDTITEKYSEK